MINLYGHDFELSTLGPNPLIGYINETREYEMMSGLIRSEVIGKRFHARLQYGWLTDEQISKLHSILDYQKQFGSVPVQIDVPGGIYSGPALISLDTTVTRFSVEDNVPRWTNWYIVIRGTRLE